MPTSPTRSRPGLDDERTLTANRGFQSNALSTLLSGPAELAHVTGSLVQQVFDGGRLRANVKSTEAQKLELVFVYLKTVQQGFREVSDALGHRNAFELRQQLTQLVSSTEDAARLSDLRYRGGVASYLEVLTSQTSFLNAELTLAQARLGELLSLVQLYAALGGGWEQKMKKAERELRLLHQPNDRGSTRRRSASVQRASTSPARCRRGA